VASNRKAALDAMVEEAIVDGYDDDEQFACLFTMIEDHLAVPFASTVLGVEVIVKRVELTAGGIVAICTRGGNRQKIDVLDLPLPTPPPAGAEWIDACRHWAGR
jgi:hypothetical protein